MRPGDLLFVQAYTAQAVERLAESGSLTALGLRFAAGMRETVAPWLAVALPDEVERAADRAREEHAVSG
ncbi:hypothetical protein [Kitasatospora herbaricolor]|uniref:hypothetical protein n=1 Tax=Kitasatospora herbaricolor TaxID=68217 RepID=UPI0036D9B266